MYSYAQTIIQLYNQMLQQGYSVSEMVLIRNTYELATSIYSGRYQISGKLFLSHIIGTASILASLRLPINIVTAGLIHNIYGNGNFGDESTGITNVKREIIKRVVGSEIEVYVAEFSRQKWNEKTCNFYIANLDRLTHLQKVILKIKLADYLELLLDYGLLYISESRRKSIEILKPFIIRIGEGIGFSSLVNEIIYLIKESEAAVILKELRYNYSYSVLIPPNSFRKGSLKPLLKKIIVWFKRRQSTPKTKEVLHLTNLNNEL